MLIKTKFKKGTTICEDGEQADCFYIIKESSVSAYKNGKMLRQMTKGDTFGEQALYEKSNRGATVLADEDVILLSLGREDFQKVFGTQVQ